MSMSPRMREEIPKGFATKLGVGGAGLAAVVGLLLEVTHVSLDKDATIALITAAVTLISTVVGRMHQAAALYRDAPSPMQGITNVLTEANDWLDGEDGMTYTPDEEGEPDLPPGAGDPTVPPGISQ